MDKKWTALILAGVVIPALVLMGRKQPGSEKREAPVETTPAETAPAESLPQVPDSVLYYGTVLEMITQEDGTPSGLLMESPRDGRYVMNLGDWTYYVNSGEHQPFDPETLQAGDRLYVFHSPMVTRSLPPQAAALVIENNIPMDISCGMLHRVEGLREDGEDLLLTIDRGTRTLRLDQDTTLWSYSGETPDRQDIRIDSQVLAWYWDRGEESLRCGDLMLLE